METLEKARQYNFILASKSPRRQEMFRALGLNYTIQVEEVDESFPMALEGAEIPFYLAEKKARAFSHRLNDSDILITADTVVWINDHVLNKPASLEEAADMLKEISGDAHSVFTAVCLMAGSRMHTFVEETRVYFHPLTEAEINYYLQHYRPLDKAGAYGIQEFIGYIGIREVHGDFYNVVGFPVQRFWRELHTFLEQ